MIKLSIVVAVYNQEELIVRALDSIARRDDIEVIVLDDCSTDNTFKVVRDYADTHQDLNIIVAQNSENKGFGITKNRMYDLASGEYITQLDSDDYLYTEDFNKVIDMLDGEDIIYQDMRINDGSIFHITDENKTGYCGGPFRFIKREFLGDTRCLEVRGGEDYELNLKLLAKNPKEKFTGIVGYHYNYPREGSLFDLMVKGKL